MGTRPMDFLMYRANATCIRSIAGQLIQKDWENREFIEMMQLNILKIYETLNRFRTSKDMIRPDVIPIHLLSL